MPDRLPLDLIPALPTRVGDASAIPAAVRMSDGVYEYIVAMSGGRPR